MRSRPPPLLFLALLLAAGSVETARAAPAKPPPLTSRIMEPDWIERPSGEDIDRVYPSVAGMFGVSGYVTMRCGVVRTGVLTDCVVVQESPKGLGFGAAALKMQPAFRMTPRYRDGVPIDGGQVTIPIRFTIAEPAMVDAKASMVGPLPSPEARRLGSRLVAALALADTFAEQSRAFAEMHLSRNTEGVDPSTIRLALSSMRSGVQTEVALVQDRVGLLYAQKLTEPELREVIAFAESPTGRKFRSIQIMDDPAVLATFQSANQRMVAAARVQFCRLQDCALDPSVPVAPSTTTPLPPDPDAPE